MAYFTKAGSPITKTDLSGRGQDGRSGPRQEQLHRPGDQALPEKNGVDLDKVNKFSNSNRN